MGMTIDDCISELTWVRKVNEEIIKTDAKEIDVDSAWIKHWKNVVKSIDMAIETIRKYQNIEQIVKEMKDSKSDIVGLNRHNTEYYMNMIERILEDGNDD